VRRRLNQGRTTRGAASPIVEDGGEVDKWLRRVEGKQFVASGGSVVMQNGEGDGGSPRQLEPKWGEEKEKEWGPGMAQPSGGEEGGGSWLSGATQQGSKAATRDRGRRRRG
jgi:hypothetical protein